MTNLRTIEKNLPFDFSNLICPNNNNIEEYGRFQQHTVLLEDEFRIAKFAKAISNQQVGDVVLDVGAGTGILSLIALKLGFKSAILIEPSKKISSYAMHLASINGLDRRIKIINKTAENIHPKELPSEIDLLVSETLSSLIFGFGSWDVMPKLCERVSRNGSIIPESGKLMASLSSEEMSTRGTTNSGFGLLNMLGLKVDLFEHTFRSGGNVYDKERVIQRKKTNQFIFNAIADFAFKAHDSRIRIYENNLLVPKTEKYCGLVLYWDVILSTIKERVTLSSLDPLLSSWYPFYIPFIKPIFLEEGNEFSILMKLSQVDAPYKYAFQFWQKRNPLTRMLYW